MITYNIGADGVDPIFYPVVPDSFMSRGMSQGQDRIATPSSHQPSAEWPEQIDRPLLAPRDHWSF